MKKWVVILLTVVALFISVFYVDPFLKTVFRGCSKTNNDIETFRNKEYVELLHNKNENVFPEYNNLKGYNEIEFLQTDNAWRKCVMGSVSSVICLDIYYSDEKFQQEKENLLSKYKTTSFINGNIEEHTVISNDAEATFSDQYTICFVEEIGLIRYLCLTKVNKKDFPIDVMSFSLRNSEVEWDFYELTIK